MSLGMTAQKKRKKERKWKVEKDLTFLFNLRFSWDTWPLSVMKGRGGLVQTLEDRCQSVPREHIGTIAVLESDGKGSYRCFKTQGKLSYLLRKHRNETSSDTLYTITSIKKWTVVETFVDPT